MVSVTICAGEASERGNLAEAFHTLGARLTEDKWVIRTFAKTEDAEAYLRDAPLVDLLCCDAREDAPSRLRANCQTARLLVVADETTSPLQYLRPQIMASSLLLRPYERDGMYQILKEFVEAYLDDKPDERENLVVKTREGRTVIPCGQVCYLEAREKKVFIRLRCEEYAVAETLDGLVEKLGGKFLRTHRSFAVNPRHIEQVNLSGDMVTLRDGFQIPLSRRYHAAIKEFLG